jgi:hypothetical protein
MNFIYNLKTLKRNIFSYKRQGMHVSAMEARLKGPMEAFAEHGALQPEACWNAWRA